MALGAVLGALLLLAGCELPWDPVEIEVYDGMNYNGPQETGIINVQDGTHFLFYSNVGYFESVVRFQVPATGSYNV
jgi:hypothetical protein